MVRCQSATQPPRNGADNRKNVIFHSAVRAPRHQDASYRHVLSLCDFAHLRTLLHFNPPPNTYSPIFSSSFVHVGPFAGTRTLTCCLAFSWRSYSPNTTSRGTAFVFYTIVSASLLTLLDTCYVASPFAHWLHRFLLVLHSIHNNLTAIIFSCVV